MSILSFWYYYFKSMRLYYSFVTGIAGWIGLEFYQHIATQFPTIEIQTSNEKKIVIIVMLFLAWGINQIINDYLGLKEDRINAPNRPMVTGKLKILPALITSALLMIIMGIITLIYLEPIALIPLILGVLANIFYEFFKSYGILGNIIFGFMIMQCTVFGFLASGPAGILITKSRISILILIWLINSLMTFYTYFKDYIGDKKQGINTIVVKYGIDKSRIIALVFSFIPTIAILVIYYNNFIVAPFNQVFIFLSFLTLFLQIKTGYLYYRYPQGTKTYYSLSTNFRASVCAHATIIALFNERLALILFIVSYIFIESLFNIHQDAKS